MFEPAFERAVKNRQFGSRPEANHTQCSLVAADHPGMVTGEFLFQGIANTFVQTYDIA
jgi:hypothetical protein